MTAVKTALNHIFYSKNDAICIFISIFVDNLRHSIPLSICGLRLHWEDAVTAFRPVKT
ncbi:hypothetical protein HMPREF6485_2054 [Segatella buccae ATCC 33574]|uniref:Uncharacterized protein n=1 Tax=Segatella buccae ATCC 33574 TaxID=873513 RepID=E6K8Z0_9BACT|nr:hypothetical protein HMPREF6485_2054 [Segatella buccae ATCC 33574]